VERFHLTPHLGQEGVKIYSSSLDDVQSLMFVYKESHLKGKYQTFTALHRLYKEIKHNNLWLEKEEQIKAKEQILNSIALIVISNAMMVIEDFILMCDSMRGDITTIPSKISTERKVYNLVQNFKNEPMKNKFFYDVLNYLNENDLNSIEFIDDKDKRIIIKVHEQNVKALEHLFGYVTMMYNRFRVPYNKYKHGHLFLSSIPSGVIPDLIEKLCPAIPYFTDERDPFNVSSVFVGEFVLDRLNTLLCGGGGVFGMLRDLTGNVTVRCKYGGKKIIARKWYGVNPLTEEETKRYEKLIEIFDSKFLISPSPKKLKLGIKSEIKRKDWRWFLEEWTMK